jgi:hypothetical protein
MTDAAVEVTSEELMEMPCPRCGPPMDNGYIAGHWLKLRWVETSSTKTMFRPFILLPLFPVESA